MKLLKKNVLYWLFVILWMLIIFLFSAQAGDDSGDTSASFIRILARIFCGDFDALSLNEQSRIIEEWQFFVRKAGHFSEYALLAALFSNALRFYKLKKPAAFSIAIGASALYAVTDEVHQYFVPDRACSAADVLIDTSGALFGALIFMGILHLISSKKSYNKQ